ncbi:hypothetical protein M747DRAFT_310036 [Aspergillus niger ATCC 13496]|uniref:Uncharacterized protein n=1 Tax=Aspergillus niger ATCC 13496 TaxID=1353008 RepID=A0A370BII4_ASPNG|nr:hypothetical protein M747DRAFT_310036 [Aspergillus niger ATCC 13496]
MRPILCNPGNSTSSTLMAVCGFILAGKVDQPKYRTHEVGKSSVDARPIFRKGVGTGKLTKRSIPKGAHSGNSGGEIAEYIFEVLLTAPVGLQNHQKEVRCRSGDIALVHGDYYSDCTLPDGSRARYSGDEEDEDERAGKIKVLAVIRDQRKNHARRDHLGQAADNDSGPVRFFFSCGAIWEAITAQNGNNYQLVAVDPGESTVNGDLKLISWTRECPSHENGENETRRDIRFRLSIVNGDFQELPIVATATMQSIQIRFQPRRHDDLKSPSSCRPSSSLPSISRERAQLLTTRDNPFGSLDVSISEPLYLLCLVLTSAVSQDELLWPADCQLREWSRRAMLRGWCYGLLLEHLLGITSVLRALFKIKSSGDLNGAETYPVTI